MKADLADCGEAGDQIKEGAPSRPGSGPLSRTSEAFRNEIEGHPYRAERAGEITSEDDKISRKGTEAPPTTLEDRFSGKFIFQKKKTKQPSTVQYSNPK